MSTVPKDKIISLITWRVGRTHSQLGKASAVLLRESKVSEDDRKKYSRGPAKLEVIAPLSYRREPSRATRAAAVSPTPPPVELPYSGQEQKEVEQPDTPWEFPEFGSFSFAPFAISIQCICYSSLENWMP